MTKNALIVLATGIACSNAQPASDTAPAADDPLADLRGGVFELIGEPSCTATAECRTIAFGAKPCGGPRGYLAYSTVVTQPPARRPFARRGYPIPQGRQRRLSQEEPILIGLHFEFLMLDTWSRLLAQCVTRPLVVALGAWLTACSGGGEASREPSAPPTGSYEDFTPEELVRVFDLREHDVPVRDLPGWAPPEKVVVVVPEEWDIRDERMAFLQEVAPDVELIPVKNRQDAVERGVLADAQAVLGLGCAASTVEAIGPEVRVPLPSIR